MRKHRIISIILIFILLISSMGVFASATKEDLKDAKEKGGIAGKDVGEIDGKNDFKKGLESNWKKSIDDDERIITRISKKKHDLLYETEFLKYYKLAYETAYEKSYNISKDNEEEFNTFTILGIGASLGMIHGEIDGFKDFESGSKSDWSKSISKLSRIDKIFDLTKLHYEDRNIFTNEFTNNYEIGYKDTYSNGHFGIKKNSKENGRTDGTTFGTIIGEIFGIKDYHEEKKSDYNRNMPKDSEIKEDYSLNKNNSDYTEGFINEFKNSYEKSYKNSYKDSKDSVILLDSSSAYKNGNNLGENKGRTQGNVDYMSKKSNDWKRSKTLTSSIISEYNLFYQTPKYRDSFIDGYWDGYSKGYTETYKEVIQGSSMGNITSETIPISGGTLRSLEGGFSVEIDKGIYYKPVVLTIDSLISNFSLSSRFISASNFYRVSMINPSGVFVKDKKIKIAFEYYGDKDGGVYQLEGGKWTYLTSVIENGTIVANVNPSTIKSGGNVFTVLVDTKTGIFHDIRGHWAKDEITTYIRRDIINGYPDNKFKPDQYITRAEFLILLSRLYQWDLPQDTENNEFFKDYESFHKYNEKHISYSLSHEYIIGYPDKYFRPYNHISYKEVDIIMKKILNDPYFKWEKYSKEMIYDKKTRSASYDSYDNNITRAEFAYMLYKLNEWKY